MEKEISKYVYITNSFDERYCLLYNSKNDDFIRYDKNDFTSFEEFVMNEQVNEYLKENNYFYESNELSEINKNYANMVESEDTLMLIIKVTRKCNFRCVYCYEYLNNNDITEKAVQSIYKFIENKIKSGKLKKINICWFGGEPLVNLKQIISMSENIINLCANNNVLYMSSVVTNGYLLTKEVAEKLISLGVNNFQITIDGPKNIHNKQRYSEGNKDTYSTILKNVYDLKDLKGNFIVNLRTNISRNLLGNLDDYINDIRPLFEDERFFEVYHTVVDFNDLSHEITDLELLNEMIFAINKGIRFEYATQYLSLKNSHCYASKKNNFIVDEQANISKCTEVNESYSIIGKLNENGNIDYNENFFIWNGARISDKCIDCINYSCCNGGTCPLYYLKHGEARCTNNIKHYDILIKIANIQERYNYTISK